MSPILISIAAFIGVAALVFGVATLFRDRAESKAEDRLDLWTDSKAAAKKKSRDKEASVLAQPLEAQTNILEAMFGRLTNINLQVLFEQADVNLTPMRLFAVCGVFGLAGAGVGAAMRSPVALLPVFGLILAGLPLLWIYWRRSRRMKQFGAQLPDALDMLARCLRSGQSLASGFNMIANEMSDPLGKEFGRVFDEQNFGVSLEESLRDLALRIPNLDLKFFVTAVVLQRQTGGDLAEILDKIGRLIRERFQIWGQIQALTGEGRISGIVLLALPVLLFIAVYYLNREYVMILFTEPEGKKLLAGAIVMQILGALAIRKIINIKV